MGRAALQLAHCSEHEVLYVDRGPIRGTCLRILMERGHGEGEGDRKVRVLIGAVADERSKKGLQINDRLPFRTE